jgi:heptosyltransferase-2
MHVLVILPRWLGDVVLSTPLLRALRAHVGPGARITAAVKPAFIPLFAGTDWIDAFVPFDKRGRDPAVRVRGAAARLRRERPDVALIVPNSLSTGLLAWLAGAKRRVGFARHGRRWLLTDPLEPPRQRGRIVPVSTAAHAMDLGAWIGVPRGPLRLELATTAAEEALADAVLARLFPESAGPLVVFNDNGAYGPSKSWGTDRFAALARLTVERVPSARVVVHCGPGDRDGARDCARRAADRRVTSLADIDDLPLGLSKALLRRAAVVVTTDSGPRHVAAAFGTPTVVLHGPMDPRLGASDHRWLEEVRLDLACSPCGRRECPLGHHDCMKLVTPAEVGRIMFDLLERSRRPADRVA